MQVNRGFPQHVSVYIKVSVMIHDGSSYIIRMSVPTTKATSLERVESSGGKERHDRLACLDGNGRVTSQRARPPNSQTINHDPTGARSGVGCPDGTSRLRRWSPSLLSPVAMAYAANLVLFLLWDWSPYKVLMR